MEKLLEPEEAFMLPSFEKGFGRQEDRFSYQKDIPFNIGHNDKVLDIGSGGGPFPLATHLCDHYPGETTHRAEALARDDRPLVVCNIERLPYRDKAFDFVFCSHVLEHVANPAKACQEIMRVGKRGYIETPTRTSDIIFNFTGLPDHHKWHINKLGKTLVFMEWADEEKKNTNCTHFFQMVHSNYKNPFQTLFHEHRPFFVNMLLWEEQFFYFVFDKSGGLLGTNRTTPNPVED
jgi:SAM-dependent methyltransferase